MYQENGTPNIEHGLHGQPYLIRITRVKKRFLNFGSPGSPYRKESCRQNEHMHLVGFE